ncbi:MAG TPA: ABC transporter permease [Candidatus Binataceae bacterium]|jgi:ABC-2 type transport system permease protein|nr:ABC transporter permease [Candidatus Binataceae bacterium]
MFGRLLQMLIKEFIQLLRDPKARFVLFAPAVIQMLVFGYAATLEVRHVPTAVLDLDHSQESRELVARFAASPYFAVRYELQNRDQIRTLIDESRVYLAIQIHPGFAALLRKGRSAPVQVVLDGTNSNTALIALGYVSDIANRFAQEQLRRRLYTTAPALAATISEVVLAPRPWFNTNMLSRWFIVPGLIGSIVLITVIQLTAFAVVRERELGTFEQIMVTPIRRSEFILGKTLPFFLVGLVDTAVVATVGTWWFGVPFRGSAPVLMLGASLFLLSMLGVGLLISTAATTQQQAMVSGFFVVMPLITFSGLGTPVSSMPEALQWMSEVNPLQHFLVVLRGLYLKGVGLEVLWPHMLAMALVGVALLAFTVTRLRKSLD